MSADDSGTTVDRPTCRKNYNYLQPAHAHSSSDDTIMTIIYLFTYFTRPSVSTLDYSTECQGWPMNWKDLKGYGRDQSKCCLGIWLERLRETRKNLIRDNWRPCQDKHQAPSGHKSEALSLRQPAR
jgi:hypothetical protein